MSTAVSRSCATFPLGNVAPTATLVHKALLRDMGLVELLAMCGGVSSLGPVAGKLDACLRHSPSIEHASMQGVSYNFRCLEAFKAGQLDHALVCADTATFFYQAAAADNAVAHVRLHSARIHRAKGNIEGALDDLQTARHFLLGRDAADLNCLAHVDLLLGALHADHGDLAPAAALCAGALLCAEDGERHWEGLYEAHLILSAANADRATDILRGARSYARARGLIELEAMLRIRAVQQAILDGSVQSSTAAASVEAIPVVDHWMVRHARTAVLAHLLAKTGKVASGLALLEDGLDEARRLGLLRSTIEMVLDRAMILEWAGQRGGATDAVCEALRAAEPSQLILPFIERRGVIHPILVQLRVEHRAERQDAIAGGFLSDVLGRLLAQEDGGKVSLSTKERAIMSDLAAGHSNKEIARKLKVSPETIRFHLKNVYSKLGVNAGRGNRRIVADFARQHIDPGRNGHDPARMLYLDGTH